MLRQMIFDGRGQPLPPAHRPVPAQWSDDAITGSVLGHSTVLLNFFGVHVLTDPVFSRRVGLGVPPFVLGPKRYHAPALDPRDLPAPDVIVLSHAHFDHFDVWSLRKFDRRTPVVTARATADLLRCHGYHKIYELDWGQTATIPTRSGPLSVTAFEVAHWGARMMRDDHRGYNGYLLTRDGHTVGFAGDTAYTPSFARLYDPARPIDLMLMPIGAYDPWIRAHCNPEQAAEMARQAGARTFVPIHHETFKLSAEAMDEPAARVRAAFATEPHRLLAVNVGETFRVPLRAAGSPTRVSS
jgi:L-ascorbate metabolism protein UlaG (beta-lactamase superfamily)